MKSDIRYLPLFFLCWAFLFSPFAVLTASQNRQKRQKTPMVPACCKDARHTSCTRTVFGIYNFGCGADAHRCFVGLSSLPCCEEAVNLNSLNYQSEANEDK